MAKATKKQALGRGLSALLQETPNINSASDKNADKVVGNIIEIELDLTRHFTYLLLLASSIPILLN